MSTVKLFHASLTVTTCSVDGVEYKAGEDGSFNVPADAVSKLVGHGFSAAKAELPPPGPEPVKHEDHEKLKQELFEATQTIAEQKGAIEALRSDLEDARKPKAPKK